jgi:hypothetical protein
VCVCPIRPLVRHKLTFAPNEQRLFLGCEVWEVMMCTLFLLFLDKKTWKWNGVANVRISYPQSQL